MTKQFDQEARNVRSNDVTVIETLDENLGIYSIRGSKGVVWTVDLNAKSCNCPDYIYRCAKLGGVCKHYIKCLKTATAVKVAVA